MKSKTGRPGQRGKSVEERIAYSLGHHVRIEILRRLLTYGAQTADDIATMVGEPRQNVHHHLKELLDAGAIQIAKVEKKRNTGLYYYCAARPTGSFDREALDAMTPEERQDIAAVIVQHFSAEVMAALAAGTLNDDSRVCLMWDALSLDAQGREELFEEQERFWKRVEEIEADSTDRRAKSREAATPYVVAQWGFERAGMASL